MAPKGSGKGGKKGGSAPPPNTPQYKVNGEIAWDPNGCARCGRSTHWARDCKATKDVLGGAPKEKPVKKGQRKGTRKGRLADLEDMDENDQNNNNEGDDDGDASLLDDDYSDGEVGTMFMFETMDDENDDP